MNKNMFTPKKNDFGISSDIQNKEEKKECCCSEHKEMEKPIQKNDCCSHNEANKNALSEKKEECCCGSANTKNTAKKEDCCSHNEANKNAISEKKEECRCGGDSPKNTAKKEDCCSIKNKEQSESCCSTKHKVKSDSCCDVKHKEQTESCCSTKHKEQTDSCGCGGAHKTQSANCCGGVPKEGSNYDKYVLWGSVVLLIVGLFVNRFHDSIWLKIFNPAYVVVIFCGYDIFANAIRGIRNKKINSSMLISVAIIASIVLEILTFIGIAEPDHYIFAAAEIAFLMKLGGALENYTVKKSKKGIKDLFNLMPKEALKLVDGEYVNVPITEIKVGDTVMCRPNNMISVDGEIIRGQTSVDQANITGESLPVEKATGDGVFSGTWNKQGLIEIKVTCEAEDTSINKLVQMVEEASGKKAPIARIADRWAGYIVPLAILISIGIFLLNFFAFRSSPIVSLVRAVTILVVFCPCALALATPTAISAGIGNLAKRGVLVRSGAALESLAKVDTIAFDKTGTLTKGELSVTEIETVLERETFEGIMLALEKNNDHPIAVAIAKKYSGAADMEISNYEIINGVGIRGSIMGKEYLLSNYNYAKSNFKECKNVTDFSEKMINLGSVVSILIENDNIIGAIALSDTIREGAAEAMNILNERYKTIMLTGDNRGAAEHINSMVGVKEVRAELLPEDKAGAIEKYNAEGRKVCMIGDGVNDAPGLALASCSIAMAELGSELAVDTAPIAIMSSDVRKLPKVFAFSRKILRTIKINIAISMTINFFAVICSAMGWLTPVTGAIVHNVSSVLVVLNSCALLTERRYESSGKKRVKQS